MAHWQVQQVVDGLQQARHDWRESQHRAKEYGGRELPSKNALKAIVNELCGILFPMRLGPTDLRQESEDFYIAYALDKVLNALKQQVILALSYDQRRQQKSVDLAQQQNLAHQIVQEFADQLPQIRRLLDTDACAAFEGDPAARSVDEVLITYPGMLAIIYHRLAHQLYADVPLLARIISEQAHSATGIDIHPGATIGQGFFIDHGTGVVIGETCIIGKNVRIYQAVTLGAKRFEVDEAGSLKKDYARHPIVEDDVVIYAGATILGRVTIGKGSTIGGNVWLTQSIAPFSQVLQQNCDQVKSQQQI
ncbi:serine acetyltransferase [Acinetobacter sp. A3.8]|uniref:serine O-acetyltransferase n=1 Tax=Acinetobacter sedimenti TaxID=2919922 RepID=A0A9X2B6P4_9GAMM|nr:serine O-acetyltransferase EpsC [Acinetobacter sedimenti]MCJ8147111.1 serine acetyltransferase [Acinetobacter sedimenti]